MIDRIEVNLLMGIDISAAFDIVDRNILIREMEIYGMDSSVTDLMWSYMSFWSQLVQIEGYQSSYVHMTHQKKRTYWQ